MKYLYYIKYFFYITFNWNLRLALFTIYHEIRGERKYKINTTRLNNLKNITLRGNRSNAEVYQGANYFLLEKVFKEMRSMGVNYSLIDFGSGKGRVMVVAAYYGFEKIIGLEFGKQLCEVAKKTIIPVQQLFPQKVLNVYYTDASHYKIDDHANVFFFFNPFNEIVMQQVIKNILYSLKSLPREVFVIYINPIHKEIFLSAGFEQIFDYQKYYYIQVSILMKAKCLE